MKVPGAKPPAAAKTRRRRLLPGILLASLGAICLLVVLKRRVQPPVPPGVDTEGLALQAVQDIDTARARVLEVPRSADNWGGLGMILVANQLEPPGHVCLEQACELAPQEFRWPYLLGVSLAVSDPPRAAENLERALALRGDVAVAHVRLGELLLELNQLEAAGKHLERALELAPDDLHALIATARLALAQDDLTAALQAAARATALAPHVRSAQEVLAQVHQRTGDRAAAVAALATAARLPDTPLPYQDPYAEEVLALKRAAPSGLRDVQKLLAEQRFGEAINPLLEAWRENPSDPIVPCDLARALAQVNNFTMAHAVLESAAEQHPLSAQIRLQRGVLFFLQANRQQAERYFREAIQRKPDYVQAHFYLGHSLEKQDRIQDAIDAFRAAAHLQPSHVEAQTNLGRLLIVQGEYAAAVDPLQTAIRFAPGNQEAQRLYAETISKVRSEGRPEEPPPATDEKR